MNANLQQRIRASLYSLKREYGDRIDIVTQVSAETDVRTGVRNVVYQYTTVERAIVLPEHIARREVRGISLISANKQLVMGGGYDNSVRVFVIDRQDTPDLLLTLDDSILYDNKKYSIEEIEEFEFDTGWIVKAKALIGESSARQHELSSTNTVNLQSESSDAGEP